MNDLNAMLPLNPKDLLILMALADGDRHGYGILKDAKDRSHGRVRLDPANLYRALQRMTRDGLVEDAGEDRTKASDGAPRRYHRLTPFGREVLRAEVSRLAELTEAARALGLVSAKREGYV